MKVCIWMLSATLIGGGMSGCATYSPTLVFGTSDTLGLTIAGGATEGGGEVTLGFRERNIAFSPVFSESVGGQTAVLGANDPQLGNGVEGASDTYSVLGSFGLQTTNQNVKLGRFFSTGFAARELARGFACSEATSAYGARSADLDPSACVNWRATPPAGQMTAAVTTAGGTGN